MRVALPLGLTEAALADAMAEADPGSLAAATRLRRDHPPEVAAAALGQAVLRRDAQIKFGAEAAHLFFTRAGLEQATRPPIADHHAARFVAAGATRVVDLGCGLGSDALAFARAGLEVLAVEQDPTTAAVAEANLAGQADLAGRVRVVCADAADVLPTLSPSDAVFCDPARRTGRGRTWRVQDFTPPWEFVLAVLDGRRPAGVKLGPALPHSFVPATAEAEWVTHRGETIELGLWAGAGAEPGLRVALVWPHPRLEARAGPAPPVRPPGRYVYEPAGAVIRAGAVAQLAARLGAGLLDPQIAFLTADTATATPYATTFAVLEVLPFDVGTIRAALRRRGIGRLEVKRRGLELDPAVFRAQLKPRGAEAGTLLISRTPTGAVALLARRVPDKNPDTHVT